MKKPVFEVISLGDQLATDTWTQSGYTWCSSQCEEYLYGCAFQCSKFSEEYCDASGLY